MSINILPYTEFRSGLTFKQVFWELKVEAQAKEIQGERMFITRKTVLGRWYQHKRSAYEHYLKCIVADDGYTD